MAEVSLEQVGLTDIVLNHSGIPEGPGPGLSEEQEWSQQDFTTAMLTHSVAVDVWDVCPRPGCGCASGAFQICRLHIGDHFLIKCVHICFSVNDTLFNLW